MSGAPGPATPRRRDVHSVPLIDGRPASSGTGARVRRRLQRLLASEAEREEADLERRIRARPGVTRPNTIALISPKGGVGKTTATFVVGTLLATHLKLRAVAVDADPDFGTQSRLARDDRRSERSLADVLRDADRLNTAAELAPYMSRVRTGLHILGAPRHPEPTTGLGPNHYGELVAFLATFYEVVLLDLGTGIVGPLAEFAIERADQIVCVTTPDWLTSAVVIDSLSHIRHEHVTVAINKSRGRSPGLEAVEQRLHHAVTIPFDERLATMLDSGTYALEALDRPTRVALKRLGLAVTERLR